MHMIKTIQKRHAILKIINLAVQALQKKKIVLADNAILGLINVQIGEPIWLYPIYSHNLEFYSGIKSKYYNIINKSFHALFGYDMPIKTAKQHFIKMYPKLSKHLAYYVYYNSSHKLCEKLPDLKLLRSVWIQLILAYQFQYFTNDPASQDKLDNLLQSLNFNYKESIRKEFLADNKQFLNS